MKKLLFFLLTLCTAFSLTSCRVNWFGSTAEVPWYFVAVPAAVILVLAYIIIMRGTYICPDCGTEIKPRWYEIWACIHFGGARIVKCPGCGRKGFCERK